LHFTHVMMVIATYRVATIPHDWHTIVRSRSSNVTDFNVIWKPVFDFLLMIKSYLGPILHRLATIHPLQRTTDDDGRQPCKTPTALQSSGVLWLEPMFPAWRNHTGWSVTTASGLTLLPWISGRSTTWEVTVVDTLGNAYLQQSAITSASADETAAVRKKQVGIQLTQQHPQLFFQCTGNTRIHEC